MAYDTQPTSEQPAKTASPSNPVDVVYIAGYGRSGSTMLELLLSGIPGFLSVGETNYVWRRGCEENVLCACGAKFWDCELWSQVIPEIVDCSHPDAFERMKKLHHQGGSMLRMPRNLVGIRSYPKRCGEYFKILDKMYASLARHSGAQVLIDSSKYPSYGLALSNADGVRLRVIHLTRDCRAVSQSWRRRKIRPEIHWANRYMPRYSVARTAAKWCLHNRLAEVLEQHAEDYVRIRYEDLVDQPAAVLDSILSQFGMMTTEAQMWVSQLRENPVLSTPQSHSVSGNPIRFQKDETAIVADQAWETEMGWVSRNLAHTVAWPLQRKYGYGPIGKNQHSATVSPDRECERNLVAN